MEINWYPGHMARAKRLLSDQLSRVDVVIELCDARLPFSSRNPDLMRLTSRKERVLLLGKSDLADQSLTAEWLNLFRRQGLSCFSACCTACCFPRRPGRNIPCS